MRRLSLVALFVCVTGLLAACQVSGPGKGPTDAGVTPNAVNGDAIEVTALDALPGDATAPPAPPGAAAAGADKAAAQGSPLPPDPQTAAPTEPTTEVGEPAPTPDLSVEPVTPKSEKQLACEKKRGKWAKVGKGGGRACIFQTKDAGKHCERESQCEGVCLARSGTCSPFKPLYGCNEILQDNGARVTLCLD
jgi:hypothetical protein